MPVAHSSRKYMRDYMQGYRKTQCEKDAKKDDLLTIAHELAYDIYEEQLYRDFVNDRIAHGYTEEQAIGQLIESVTPPSENQPEETRPSCAAADAVPEMKPCADFGKKLHKDSEPCDCSFRKECDAEYIREMFKNPAQKEAERRAKTIAILEMSKELNRKRDLRDLIEVGAIFQAQRDAEEKQLDVLTQKYLDRGVPEATARKDAGWELKQMQYAERMRKREAQGKWDLLTLEEQSAERQRLLKESKKLREGSKNE